VVSYGGNGDGYGDGVDNDTAGWHEIDLSVIEPPKEGIPFRLFVNRFKSSSPESEAFLHDPRRELAAAIAGFDGDWRVSTFIVNHHRTLSYRHVYVMAAASSEEQTVGLTIVKQNPG
jgi:hypothetical protein